MKTHKEQILTVIKRFNGIKFHQIENRLQLSRTAIIKRISDLKYEGKIIEKKNEYHFVKKPDQQNRSKQVKEMRFQKFLLQGMKRYNIDAVTLGTIAANRKNKTMPKVIEVPETLNQVVFDELVKTVSQWIAPKEIELIQSVFINGNRMFFSFYTYSSDNINRILKIAKLFQEKGQYKVNIVQKPEIDKEAMEYIRTRLQIQITQK